MEECGQGKIEEAYSEEDQRFSISGPTCFKIHVHLEKGLMLSSLKYERSRTRQSLSISRVVQLDLLIRAMFDLGRLRRERFIG